MAGFKNGISKLYARARDRAYTAIYTKQGRTDRGLRSSLALKNRESGNSKIRWTKAYRIALVSIDYMCVKVNDKLMEKSRVSLVRSLSKILTKEEYLLRYPIIAHQILRHHGLATGGSAGRVSKGMKMAFGTSWMLAAKLYPTQSCIEVYVLPKSKDKISKIKEYLKKIRSCMPFKAKIMEERITPKIQKNHLKLV